MPYFIFKSSHKEQLINTIIVERNVMTLFYNESFADELALRTGKPNLKFPVLVHHSNGEKYKYIHDGEKEHAGLHESFQSQTGFHHHVQAKNNFTAHDFAGYMGGMNNLTNNKFMDMQEAIKAVEAFMEFASAQKSSYKNKTSHALEITPQPESAKHTYLKELNRVLTDNNLLKYNAKANKFSLQFSWLKQLGADAKRQLSENLDLTADDFSRPSL